MISSLAAARQSSGNAGHGLMGSGHSSDCLVSMYPLLFRLFEKGAGLPFLVPETVCYEHHFPRGWFSIERHVSGGSASAGGAGASAALSDASPYFQSSRRHKVDRMTAVRVEEKSRMVMSRKTSRECDSGVIRKAFSNGVDDTGMNDAPASSPQSAKGATSPSRRQSKKPSALLAVCVRRDANGIDLDIRYLDYPALADVLITTPETCILSKAVHSHRPQYDVICATWTPSVFAVEHRENRRLLKDDSVPIQDRGDTANPSKYHELQCSPLTAQIIRQQIHEFVTLCSQFEKKQICELKATFRIDKRDRVWFLWADACLFITSRVQKPLFRLPDIPKSAFAERDETTDGNEILRQVEEEALWQSELWRPIEAEVAWRVDTQRRRAAAALIAGSGPAQRRGHEPDEKKFQRLEKAHYGRHPSFSRVDDVDRDAARKVEEQLSVIMSGAKRGASTPQPRRTCSPPTNSDSASMGSLSASRGRTRQSPFLHKKIFAGTSFEKPSAGLRPMIPLCLLPSATLFSASTNLDDSFLADGRSLGSPTPRASGATPRLRTPSALFREAVETAGSMTILAHALPSFVTSPVFVEAPSESDGTSPTMNERRKSVAKIAVRSPKAQQAPSPWMRAIQRTNSTVVILDSPRDGKGQSSGKNAPPASPPVAAAAASTKKRRTRAQFDQPSLEEHEHRVVRRFVPEAKRELRKRASMVMSGKAEMLDISLRLQYNELKRLHAAVVEELDDVLYYCQSESLNDREEEPILFDLPRGCPPVSDELMKSFGFCLTAHNAELDRMYLERYYVVAHRVNLPWAFAHLKAAVEDLCYDDQMKFWQSIGDADDVQNDTQLSNSTMSPVGLVQHKPVESEGGDATYIGAPTVSSAAATGEDDRHDLFISGSDDTDDDCSGGSDGKETRQQ